MDQLDRSLLQLMMEIGFLATGYGLFDDAEKIFTGLKQVCPESCSPSIGLAFSKMSKGNMEEAIVLLESELENQEKGKDAELVRAYLALALKLAGRSERAKSLAEELIKEGTQESAVNMAKAILEEV
ncbi:MAG: hypothetical protein JRI31_01710 [Deltaproteobacteria bacterium]|nr:hypothetical protein [Deltaproteobacteria bacterium]